MSAARPNLPGEHPLIAFDDRMLASTGFLLAMIGAESRRRWVRALEHWDLRPSHFGALMILGHVESIGQNELGNLTGIDPRNLVPVLDVLEERGLARRETDPADRRRHAVRLTPAGRQLLAKLQQSGATAEAELLRGLDIKQRGDLHQLLLKLLPTVSAKGEPPSMTNKRGRTR